jgi:hypothetical protein
VRILPGVQTLEVVFDQVEQTQPIRRLRLIADIIDISCKSVHRQKMAAIPARQQP